MCNTTELNNKILDKINDFLKRSEIIEKEEYHPAQEGFPFSYVDGPLYNTWMNEIYMFSERYLKKHPLYKKITETYSNHNKKPSAYDDMIGYLNVLATDIDFFTLFEEEVTVTKGKRTIEQLLSEDIERCKQFLSSPEDEDIGRELYSEITAKYDSEIDNFGSGLYQYYPEYHFYDPEISVDTLKFNLKKLMYKMISYNSKLSSSANPVEDDNKIKMNNNVFIVHGHDNEAKQEMARTLEKGGFKVIILHEQPDSGKTIIEKIEKYSDVSFAVVLYTECDIGRDKTSPQEKEKFRARQNVVFEHGYLIGKLGRDHVCALVKGQVETPGDINGVVYIPMDSGGAWKIQLAKNIKEVGLSVDMNTFCF